MSFTIICSGAVGLSETFPLLFCRFQGREFLEARIIPQQSQQKDEEDNKWRCR